MDDLAASEERFRSLVTTIPDIIYRIDKEGRFLFINEAVRRLGWNPKELWGKHFCEFILPADCNRVSRDQVLPGFRNKVTGPEKAPKLFDERRTLERRTTGLEVLLPFKGSRNMQPGMIDAIGKEAIVAEINSSGMYMANPDSRDQVLIGTVGVIRDISVRKQIERRLVNSETRLMTILKHIQAGIIVVDVETRKIAEVNDAAFRWIGGDSHKIVGSICHRYICPAEEGKCPVLDLGKNVDTSEKVLLTQDGKEIPILKTVVPLKLDGRPHLLETFLDISDIIAARSVMQRSNEELESKVRERTVNLQKTNQKLMQEITQRERVEKQLMDTFVKLKKSQVSLIQAEKMSALGILTAGIAHELNNPLMGMLNFTEYCLKHTPEQDRRHEILSDTVRETGGVSTSSTTCCCFPEWRIPKRKSHSFSASSGCSDRFYAFSITGLVG